MDSLRLVIICLLILGPSVANRISKNSEITSLKAQLASAQPTAVSGAVFIEPIAQPLDRVTWTDPTNGTVRLLACGEVIADDQTGEMRLVSQYRRGKTIAKIDFMIP